MELTVLMYLIPSLIMFGCGVYGFVTRKNMIAILISLELMLNSVDINFVVFNSFLFPGQLEGMFFTLFAIAIAAAETALALAIVINVYRKVKNVDIKEISKMKF
ncbi:MAG: NADH-quinone oxidoreductase subunit NuoK [Muribaculaceae bacterium]